MGPTFPARFELAQPGPLVDSTLGPYSPSAYFVVVLALCSGQAHAPLMIRQTINVFNFANL